MSLEMALTRRYCEEVAIPLPQTLLDIGCSTGYSSRNLQKHFPDLRITGVDASPFFLAVAETEERCAFSITAQNGDVAPEKQTEQRRMFYLWRGT